MVLACGLAPSLPVLMAARLGSGLATGWIIPFALAFVGDVIPYERRQQVIGRFLSGQILGQLFGQTAGGVLGDYFGWRNGSSFSPRYWRPPRSACSTNCGATRSPMRTPHRSIADAALSVSYTHLRAHETRHDLV